MMTEEQKAKAIKECEEAMASITAMDGLTIELRGVWVWVSGNTKQHHVALKGAGFKFAPKKKMWFWHPTWLKSERKSAPASMDYIRKTYEGRSFDTDDGERAAV